MSRLLAALLVLLVPGAAALGAGSVVIRSTTVIDVRTGTAREGTTIIVEGGRISAIMGDEPLRIPDGATVIDGRNCWVVPGYVDVHAHDSSDRDLMRAVALGITTIHLMPRAADASLAPRQAARPAADPVPRIHLTPVLFSGTFPDNIVPGVYPIVAPRNAEEVRSHLTEQAAADVGQIKLVQDDGRYFNGPDRLVPRLTPEVYDALVAGAHRRGWRVYVHATQVEDTRQAIRAGVDAFMHGTMDAALDDSLIAEMRERGIAWTPAHRVLLGLGDPAGFARRVLSDRRLEATLSAAERKGLLADTARSRLQSEGPFVELATHIEERLRILGDNTRRVSDAGVPVAVGSDSWLGPGTHVEMELMSEAGLAPAEVLKAATWGGAVALGVDSELGTIAPGKRGDLLVLGADPLVDVRNAREVEWTMKAGNLFRSRDLLRDSLGKGDSPQ